MRLPYAGKNVEANAACGDRGKGVDLLVPDCLPGKEWLPLLLGIVPRIKGILLHMLAVVEPLHSQGVVESDGMIEAEFEDGLVRSRRRRPERVWVVVERRTHLGRRRHHSVRQICLVAFTKRIAEFLESSHKFLFVKRLEDVTSVTVLAILSSDNPIKAARLLSI